MFHYLTKMLRFHGLYFDEHVIWREVQVNFVVIYYDIWKQSRFEFRPTKMYVLNVYLIITPGTVIFVEFRSYDFFITTRQNSPLFKKVKPLEYLRID